MARQAGYFESSFKRSALHCYWFGLAKKSPIYPFAKYWLAFAGVAGSIDFLGLLTTTLDYFVTIVSSIEDTLVTLLSQLSTRPVHRVLSRHEVQTRP